MYLVSSCHRRVELENRRIPGRILTVLKTCAPIAVILIAVATSVSAAKQAAPQKVARQIDQALAKEVFTNETELAPRTSDMTFIRRVWLDLVGDLPTPEDVTAFLLDPAADKRERLIDGLLADAHFGQNWARYWRDVVFFRELDQRAELASTAMEADLTKWLNQGRPWDEIATEFITARGDVREQGSTAIVMAQDGRTEETTAEISRIFLGIQIQCAQCHDHPYDRWKREQFHELAAFFPRITVRPVRDLTRRSFEVVGTDRFGRRRRPNNARFPTAEHYMPDLEDPQAPGTEMHPKFFLTSASVPWGTKDADRRGQLAEWLTANEWFSTALANRMWAELVGEGFYPVVDDIGPDRTPVAPTAVQLLAQKFAESGYDVKWLMKTICLTEAYQRESRPRRTPEQLPFTANIPQRLRSDQLFNSLLTALGAAEPLPKQQRGRANARATWRGRFAEVFGYDPSIAREEAVSSIPQVLALMNSPEIERLLRDSSRRILNELAEHGYDDDQILSELFLRCLCREPTSAELSALAEYRAAGVGRQAAADDLIWALVNSAEFQHRN